ncbi:type I-E CRISPR-associated protein Cse1/CasA [Symbiobacterium thermophilum]|uniref:type I-E CRISPR-associated protein Cse1/CasA n=1 Tax=Symbiobacterium thermophilum TaxID=2734 RepID=UPI002357DF01|nr:type I-E CRISPR-associated protein Cse1/CasA [Symbiobacterium thermophilum]
MPRFSLWEDPWIPVIRLSGHPDRLSLRQALAEAHVVREVCDPSPLVVVAIHRLLMALIYRVYRPVTRADWAALWNAGRFDPGPLDGYGAFWMDRFELFHPERPFYQVPFIDGEKVHPISALVLEAASGNNPTLFDHGRVEGGVALPPDRAACHLLAHQLFALGGGVSKPFNRMDAPLTKGLVVEALDANLFRTLLLNTIPLDDWEHLIPPREEDAPFWEVDDPAEPVREGTPVMGPLHYLTWQSRQLHLCIDQESGLVTGCQIRQRYALPKDGLRLDPGKVYQQSPKEGFVPFKLNKERAVWQYTHVLLQTSEQDYARPYLTNWLATMHRFRSRYGIAFPSRVILAVTGLTTDPQKAAKVELWRRERLPLPMTILDQPELMAEVEEMLAEARRVEGLLSRTAQALVWASAERKALGDAVTYTWTGKLPPGKKLDQVKGLARSLGMVARYWPQLEEPFRRSIEDLAVKSAGEVRSAWREAVMMAARDAFRSGRDGLLHTEASFEVLTCVGSAFHGKLSRIFAAAGEEETESDEGAIE